MLHTHTRSCAWHDRVPNHHHLWHRRVSLLWALSLAFAAASAFASFFIFSSGKKGLTPSSELRIKGRAWAGKGINYDVSSRQDNVLPAAAAAAVAQSEPLRRRGGTVDSASQTYNNDAT